jgi:hypothetical protein
MDYEDYSGWDDGDEEDAYEQDVRERLIEFFEKNQKKVFFSRQLELKLEDNYFHWITNETAWVRRRDSLAVASELAHDLAAACTPLVIDKLAPAAI